MLIQATDAWDKRESKNLVSKVMIIDDDIFYCQRAPYGIYQYQRGENKLIYDGLDMNGEMAVFIHNKKLYFMKKTEAADDIFIQYDPKTERMTELLTLRGYRSVDKIIDGYLYYTDTEGKLRKTQVLLP